MKKYIFILLACFSLLSCDLFSNFPDPPSWIIGTWRGEETEDDQTTIYIWEFSDNKITEKQNDRISEYGTSFFMSYTDSFTENSYQIEIINPSGDVGTRTFIRENDELLRLDETGIKLNKQ